MPLKILICGAGIVGLSAAIPLGQQGHEVHLYEKSSFSNEVGAAFHFGPHAHRILRRWGLDTSTLKPCICMRWQHLDWDLKLVETKFDLREKQRRLGVEEDELMVHRVDAHAWLREAALRRPNVHLHLSSAIESVDTKAASITLKDGTVHTGDVVVGADGVHSKTVQAIAGDDCPTTRVGINMYRFMVPTEKAYADPTVRSLLDEIDFKTTHVTIYEKLPDGPRTRPPSFLVVYPCRDASLLNCATFQPASMEKVQVTSSWTNPGKLEDVLGILERWPERFRRLIAMGEDIKHWAVVARAVAPTFHKDKLVLIGDAAHPTQPTHGAGAGIGLEDAAALGVLLDATVSKEDVQRRLELYNELRYERGTTVKYASEMLTPATVAAHGDQKTHLKRFIPEGDIPADMEAYLWPFDAMGQAAEALRRLEA